MPTTPTTNATPAPLLAAAVAVAVAAAITPPIWIVPVALFAGAFGAAGAAAVVAYRREQRRLRAWRAAHARATAMATRYGTPGSPWGYVTRI